MIASASAALRGSAILWFVTALVGHWLFAYYIAGHYVAKILARGTPGLSETNLADAYSPGDTATNIALALHVLFALIIHAGGPLQLIPVIRNRLPALHRMVGRSYMIAAVVASVSGIYMVWFRGANEGWVPDSTNTIGSALVLAFAFLALRCARAGDFDTHRRWALRLFMAASAVWFVRIESFALFMLLSFLGVEAMDVAGQIFIFAHLTKLILPLGLLELYFRAQERGSVFGKWMTASLLVIATVLTGVGIFGIATFNWIPGAGGHVMELNM